METKKKKAVVTAEVEIAKIEKQSTALETQAASIVIKSDNDLKGATEFIANVKKQVDDANKLAKFFTDPYVEQRRVALEKKNEIAEMFDKRIAPLNNIIATVKRSIADYTLEQERKAQAEEDRRQKIRDAANAKREERGEGQILTPVNTVERAAPTVKTEAGRTTTKKVWKFEVQKLGSLRDDKKFMDELFALATRKDIHEQVLRQMVKDGVREVAGVRIYEDVEVSVSAN